MPGYRWKSLRELVEYPISPWIKTQFTFDLMASEEMSNFKKKLNAGGSPAYH